MSEDDKPWTNLGFEEAAAVYESPSQNARVLTEGWVGRSLFCPNCGAASLAGFNNNRPVADFGCGVCHEEYELKSQKGRFGPKVVDGAYATMMGRLAASNNPNLILMNYDKEKFSVTDLFIVPKQFFTQEVIEQRKPLSSTARRAGWVGCNIRLDQVPASGKVYLVRERQLMPRDEVLERWRSTLFLRGATAEARGWLIEVMKCVEQLGLATFGIEDAYSFEEHLSRLYPNNQNVRPKIRQQLQVLRDQGYLNFVGRGQYRLRLGQD